MVWVVGEMEKKQLLDAVKADAKRFSASKESAEAILQEAGILTKKGNLTKPYRQLDAAKAGSK